jgi:hypothetical protein
VDWYAIVHGARCGRILVLLLGKEAVPEELGRKSTYQLIKSPDLTGLLLIYAYLRFNWAFAFFCAELFFCVGFFLFGSAFFFGIQ